ncbi:MAG: EF-hand domain-containing protein [Rhodospirillales bacterium]|nr:EF-hand domain-containing protein [Alphaproteobacteria bacterium]MCB9986270.1 EF-hand domain-containing protein [Rhodospirillales bacterium]USO07176.1 MAG: EF-hand domain-containing protein [Rhodospirillales bacterium]
MTIRKILLSTLALSMLAVPALAQDAQTPPPGYMGGPHGGPGGPQGGPHGGMEKMLNADTNGDGMLSKAEFMAVQEKRFDEMDANKDGQVSKDEMKAYRETMRSKFEEKRKEWEAKKGAGAKSGDAE